MVLGCIHTYTLIKDGIIGTEKIITLGSAVWVVILPNGL